MNSVYNTLYNTVYNRYNTKWIKYFMVSEKSKTSDPYRLLLNLSDKTHLKRSNRYIALSNLSIYYTWKNIKKPYKNSKFKISAPSWNDKFELPPASILYLILKIILSTLLKNMKQ